jgi:hypothetical protein
MANFIEDLAERLTTNNKFYLTMKVFLSWAGDHSKHMAKALYTWLPQVIQSLDPWMSTRIDKGDAWDGAIAEALNSTPIGILCLTQESLDSKYLHYEAGAIANVKGSKVCTLLFGIKNIDVKQPISRFQHTNFTKEDIFILLQTINNKVRENDERTLTDIQLQKSLDLNWDELVEAFNTAPAIKAVRIDRSERDLLEDILQNVRDVKLNTESIKQNKASLHTHKVNSLESDILQGMINSVIESKGFNTVLPSQHSQEITQILRKHFPNNVIDESDVKNILIDMDLF